MKAIWAKRQTKCSYCGDFILKGMKRVDELIVGHGGSYIRVHYHWENPPCFQLKVDGWFMANPFEETHTNGRKPTLDLIPEDRIYRKKLLTRMSALRAYYMPRLNLQSSVEGLSEKDLKRLEAFAKQFDAIRAELEGVGGVPQKYQGPSLAQSLGQPTQLAKAG